MLVKRPVIDVLVKRLVFVLLVFFAFCGIASAESPTVNIGLSFKYDPTKSGKQFADGFKSGGHWGDRRPICASNQSGAESMWYFQIYGSKPQRGSTRSWTNSFIYTTPINETLVNANGDVMRVVIHPLGHARHSLDKLYGNQNSQGTGYCSKNTNGRVNPMWLEYPMGTTTFGELWYDATATRNEVFLGLWKFEVLDGEDLSPGTYSKVITGVGIKRRTETWPSRNVLHDVVMTLSIDVEPVTMLSMPFTDKSLTYNESTNSFTGSIPFSIKSNSDYKIKVEHMNSGNFANNPLMPLTSTVTVTGGGANGSDLNQDFTGNGGEVTVTKSGSFSRQAGNFKMTINLGNGVQPGAYNDQIRFIVESIF